ncbi:hypothetical protein V6N13_044193 [Hibiscus sabdariffa]
MLSFSSNEDNKSNVVSSVSWEYTREVLCRCGLKCSIWHDEDMSDRAKFLIYELKKENEELRKMNLSNEQFEVQQMKLELKSMKKQPVLAVEYSDMIRNTNVGWMELRQNWTTNVAKTNIVLD